MAKGDELPISTEQHKRAFVAEAMDERKSRATDARTPAKGKGHLSLAARQRLTVARLVFYVFLVIEGEEL